MQSTENRWLSSKNSVSNKSVLQNKIKEEMKTFQDKQNLESVQLENQPYKKYYLDPL